MKKLLVGLLAGLASPAVSATPADWPTYGHDAGGMRYSPLNQIKPANVASLQIAWTYHMRPPRRMARRSPGLTVRRRLRWW